MRMSILIVLGLLSFNLRAEEKQPVPVKSVKLVVPAQAGRVVENTGKVFARQVQQRCEAKVVTGGDALLTVELAVEKGIGNRMKHYGDFDLEMSCKKLVQSGAIKQFIS